MDTKLEASHKAYTVIGRSICRLLKVVEKFADKVEIDSTSQPLNPFAAVSFSSPNIFVQIVDVNVTSFNVMNATADYNLPTHLKLSSVV